MTKWRIIVWIGLVVLMLTQFQLLGFHVPSVESTGFFVILVGIAIIACICDAVEAVEGVVNED